MTLHRISPAHIDFSIIRQILSGDVRLELSEEAKDRINRGREYLDNKIKAGAGPIYGVNTGFGALYNKSISDSDLEQLQTNLVMSHACGVGEEMPPALVRLMMFLKIQALSYGNSAVQLQTVQRLVDFFNHDVLPVIYRQGSLGASGDLAPLAHLSLPLIGMGEVDYKGSRRSSEDVLARHHWERIRLRSKEGLALLNGTQFMSACGSWAVTESERLMRWADVIAAISLEAFDGRPEPFHHLLQEVRPHAGQIQTAIAIRELLQGSELINRTKEHVQDPYSFRCIPQVHGASKDAFNYVSSVFFNEINSVTDNPTVFPDHDLILSGGNFHGQPLALGLDFLSIALSELGNISERRTYQLISGQRGLPPFLVANSGLNSGFMIPQYTAASLVSENKQLCTPASVDSIVSSNGQEDHVSMGANAATKCLRVVQNVKQILAIELFTACQALEFRRPLHAGTALEKTVTDFRTEVPFLSEDTLMAIEMQKAVRFLDTSPLP